MSLSAMVSALYLREVQTDNVRYRQYPSGLAGIAIADDAAYDEIVASTVITTINWLAKLNIGIPGAGVTADTEEVIACGTGGADGATVAFATLLLEQELLATIDTAVGEYVIPQEWLPIPIRVAASTRYAGRISTSATGGMAISMGIEVITGLGS